MKNEAKFIERFVEYGKQTGFTRNVARVLGWLIICQPARQTSANIQAVLHVSAGTVSGATTLLKQLGLVEEAKYPDDRKLYYEVKPGGFRRASEQRLQAIKAGKQLASDWLVHDPHNPRLNKMLDIYNISEAMMENLLTKLRHLDS